MSAKAGNLAHVQLMTMLNVKATHPRDDDEHMNKSEASKKVRSYAPRSEPRAVRVQRSDTAAQTATQQEAFVPDIIVAEDDNDENHASKKPSSDVDAFHWHFDADAPALEGIDAEHIEWAVPRSIDLLGGAQFTEVKREHNSKTHAVSRPQARVWKAFETKSTLSPIQAELLTYLGTYVDIWNSRVTIPTHSLLREVCAMHAMSHLVKTRQRILKDNEKLAKAAAQTDEHGDDDELPEFRDQGFTRPKVLLLAPFRHTAKMWAEKLIAYAGCEQVEQKSRFFKEFSLPPGSVDKLADPEFAHRYPEDHRHTFQGNIDDNFKLGVKITRKTVKLYSAFYESDIVIASPLGLRLLIEKERDADYLSSIEIVIADQLDVMLMQNWEHVKFVMERLNHIPKEAHDTDFSRVKPWYLDGHASLLRQTILLSSFDAPEFRQLWHTLRNVGGRMRTTPLEALYVPSMSHVTPGVRQTFFRFECNNAQSEADQRATAFHDKILSLLKKSAVTTSHTMIVVPSYFDFVRLEDDFRKMDPAISYTTLSEYSSSRDISRAREAFFSGKKSVLLLSERFHFYRRYLIRGAVTVIFYAPPEHAAYYPELINAPLTARDASSQASTDAADLQVWTLFSKYDLLRLERIVGAQQARKMLTNSNTSYRFM